MNISRVPLMVAAPLEVPWVREGLRGTAGDRESSLVRALKGFRAPGTVMAAFHVVTPQIYEIGDGLPMLEMTKVSGRSGHVLTVNVACKRRVRTELSVAD